jgi:hypothetical protein
VAVLDAPLHRKSEAQIAGLPAALPQPSAARTLAWLPGVRNGADHQSDAGGHWAD